jgi:hypothetical protein
MNYDSISTSSRIELLLIFLTPLNCIALIIIMEILYTAKVKVYFVY